MDGVSGYFFGKRLLAQDEIDGNKLDFRGLHNIKRILIKSCILALFLKRFIRFRELIYLPFR